jgi:hypothetical protein
MIIDKEFNLNWKIDMRSLILFLILGHNVFAQQSKWRFVKETNDIKVFYRELPNTNLKEVKIQTTFNSSLSAFVEALTDVDSYPKWVYKDLKSRKIKEIAPGESIYYNMLDFPWPLNDRDVVIHTKVTQNPQTKEVTSVSYAMPKVLPNTEEVVRIKEFNSKWVLTPVDKKIVAEYVFSSNPGGNIPVWMVNMSLDAGPVHTIQNLKKLLLSDKYKKVNSMGIVN